MFMLSLDCCLDRISIAVSDESRYVLALQEHENHFDAASVLASMIANVLKSADITMKDVAVCITTVGPGSFTGIRAGISTAYGIAAACPNIRLYGITSFEAVYASYQHTSVPDNAIIALDTRRNDYYFQDAKKSLSPQVGTAEQIVDIAKAKNIELIITNKTDGLFDLASVSVVEQKITAEALPSAVDMMDERPLSPLYLKEAAVKVKCL
ncbi:MAG: tRNA (adenosine(37)-N6)-threonylcarbamoyltransferase complex dimerization subunit type 1 TsaB [Holosporales bacterium]|jgi:tRNA threonylcarbamoyladenosine biosynthesis protein TsaB|nr:tRNA (adenosine(37)-N6)-threonylcarbamoyltransferase complex dimerization subunit type 1 TsaB [Holosporales bacterium]